jgi:glucose-6-phosphate isomerase
MSNCGDIKHAPTFVDWSTGSLTGEGIEESVKKLGQLEGLFQDDSAWRSMDPGIEVYRVQFWRPVKDGTAGGLFWGSTEVRPGRVGDEFFMTHGHFHLHPDRAEVYATIRGSGMLLLMTEDGQTWAETMAPGSVHYIPGRTGHRVANVGAEPLVFVASWPSDAGHDYERVRTSGFPKRLVLRNGAPCLV